MNRTVRRGKPCNRAQGWPTRVVNRYASTKHHPVAAAEGARLRSTMQSSQNRKARWARQTRDSGFTVAAQQDAAFGSCYEVTLQQLMFHRVLHQFGQRRDIELLHQPRLVGADGLAAQRQLLGNVIDVNALGQALEHRKLTFGQQGM